MSKWPDFMPVPDLNGYELQPQKGTSRTDMESGPARVRQRFTRTPTFIPQNWLMTQKQFGYFEWWLANSIDNGAAWFDAPQKNGTGLLTVQCRFIDKPKSKPEGNSYWRVTAVLEVDDMPHGNLVDFWPDDEPTLVLDFLSQTYEVAG